MSDFEKLEFIASHFKMLSDPTRLQILFGIAKKGLNVSEIIDFVTSQRPENLSQPSLSRHLLGLRLSGFVKVVRSGQNRVYSLTDKGSRFADFASKTV